MGFKEKNYLFLFFILSGVISFILSIAFYFLASKTPKVLNIIALAAIVFLVILSFLKNWKKMSDISFFQRFLKSIPIYFYIINFIIFLLISLPGLIQKKTISMITGSFVGFLLIVFYILRIVLKPKKKSGIS
ncbi:MAG TPA: hypothetical protein DHW82_02005 [Spirochaetia bacterium]|nr:MAG: hypothetical protein A2Y41_07685 [Spirochaetes bacterium GWB1_36_13]HCL55770.1 hypothetical protein [Spirochaetia bacterium]